MIYMAYMLKLIFVPTWKSFHSLDSFYLCFSVSGSVSLSEEELSKLC